MEISSTVKEFCEKNELIRFAYIDAGGYPRVVPLWFATVDGDYYVGTGASSPKTRAIRRDPRAGWVVDGGENRAYWGVSMVGRAEEVMDRAKRAMAYQALGTKYFGRPDHAKFVEIYGEADNPDTVYFRLKPEQGNSWEY